MSDTPIEKGGFIEFSNRLTGYRASMVLMLAHRSGLFAHLGSASMPASALCQQLGWDPVCGRRLLDCLHALEILEASGDKFRLHAKVAGLLDPCSPLYQGAALDFEQELFSAWQQLESTVRTGRRIHGSGIKPPDELHAARKRYLGAMDGAARIRAVEVWDCLDTIPEQGRILDTGAGSGAFLCEFLRRCPHWSAIYCDLPEIVDRKDLHSGLDDFAGRISWCGCNLLSDEPSPWDRIPEQGCDLVLLSNLIHCQGETETRRLLAKALTKLSSNGRLLIHDFFKDGNPQGMLYDLHMMINTYNGRTYAMDEILRMCGDGFPVHHTLHRIPSGSSLLVVQMAAKEEGL